MKINFIDKLKDEPFGSSFHYAFIRFLCLAKLLNASLCCCQTRDRNAERRALLWATALVSLKMETPGPFRGCREDVVAYINEFYK